eukprot:2881386-Rhodomonas_salina.1
MASEVIQDRRSLFELFVEILNVAGLLEHATETALDLAATGETLNHLTTDAIDLWSKMFLADLEHDKVIADNVKNMQVAASRTRIRSVLFRARFLTWRGAGEREGVGKGAWGAAGCDAPRVHLPQS